MTMCVACALREPTKQICRTVRNSDEAPSELISSGRRYLGVAQFLNASRKDTHEDRGRGVGAIYKPKPPNLQANVEMIDLKMCAE